MTQQMVKSKNNKVGVQDSLPTSCKLLAISSSGGFVALFTVLIAGIILTMAIGIANVTYKELVLSSEARDANIAFFAADTGAECALYWDIGNNTNVFYTGQLNPIYCNDQTISFSTPSLDMYMFEFAPTLDTCAVVSVNKNFPIDVNGVSVSHTRITSRGFTAQCTGDGSFQPVLSPKSIERSVRATYPNPVIVLPPGGGGPGGSGSLGGPGGGGVPSGGGSGDTVVDLPGGPQIQSLTP